MEQSKNIKLPEKNFLLHGNRYQDLADALNSRKEEKLTPYINQIIGIISEKGHGLKGGKRFSQDENPSWVTPLVQPQALEKKHGEAKLAEFIGAYKKEEIPIVFSSLRKRLLENNNLNERVVLDLHCAFHTISLAFNPVNDGWEIFSINDLSPQPMEIKREIIHGQVDISDRIQKGFAAEPGNMVLEIDVSSTKSVLKLAKPSINAWLKDLDPLHAITAERANLTNSSQESWLYTASKAGNEKLVSDLLAAGATIQSKISHKNIKNPLYEAAERGYSTVVDMLLSQPGIIPNEKIKKGSTALHIAASFGHTDIVQKLLQAHWDPNLTNDEGATPILAAMQNGHYKVVKLLLQIENLDLRSSNTGITLLSAAADYGHLEALQILLKKKSLIMDPNEKDSAGQTALQSATFHEHLGIVNALLSTSFKTKIDVNFKTEEISSALYWAAEKGNRDIAHALIEAKADVDATYQGRTPASIAARKGHAAIIDLLAEEKADFNIVDAAGWTPALLATFSGHSNVLETLAKFKVNLDCQVNGITLASMAVQKEYVPIVKILIAVKADLNRVDAAGRTPLHWAILAANDQNLVSNTFFKSTPKSYELVQLLLAAGVRLDIRDEEGKVPLDYANDAVKQYIRKMLSPEPPKQHEYESRVFSKIA